MFEEFTLEQVEAYKKELRSKLEANDAGLDLDKVESELQELEKRETELRAQAAETEKRERIMQKIAAGIVRSNPVTNPVAGAAAEDKEWRSLDDVLASKEYRSAFAKKLMGRALSEAEQRAVDTAVTTTATTFVEASSGADGVNNGGLFIPTELNLSLMKELELVSPIFRDVNKTNFAGVLKFPYAVSRNEAKRKGPTKETTENEDGQVEWAMLELKDAEISVTIPVTWKLEAMAVDQFYGYFLTELKNQVSRSLISGVIYGSGSDDMEGVTIKAVQKTYTGTVLAAIEANISAIDAQKKVGAKLYISTTAAESIQFSKDSNGDYIFPLTLGLPKTIAGYPLEVDPYLKDGDIVFGNVGKYARLNTVEAMSVTKDMIGKKRRNEYTAYMVAASAAQPSTLVYIKKTTGGGG